MQDSDEICTYVLLYYAPSRILRNHSMDRMMATPNNSLLRHDVGSSVAPGDRLGLVARGKTQLLAGRGTYVRRGHLYASLVGTLTAARRDGDGEGASAEKDQGRESWTISVEAERRGPEDSRCSTDVTMGTLVLGRIGRVVRPSHATVDVVAVVPDDDNEGRPAIVPLREPFSGTLRQNEIRPNSSLEVRIEECVRPGDLILARIHADGERDFILTTAEAELGVIRANCESSGVEMRAVSWKEMQCPVTGVKEGRKVAKPRQVQSTA